MNIRSLMKLWRMVKQHPMTVNAPGSAVKRFMRWQLGSRILTKPVIYDWVNESRLIVKRGMTGATGNIYVGLMEYRDMSFCLHYLRPCDLFGDIGANVGVYTVLGSACCGCRTVSIEPIRSSVESLIDNVKINDIENLVHIHQVGISSKEGELIFTNNREANNRVVIEFDPAVSVRVPVNTMDNIFGDTVPNLIKIDVEGYEAEALIGAQTILSDENLKVMILELNGSGDRYQHSDQNSHDMLLNFGFKPHDYDPLTRYLRPLTTFGTMNTIYIRDHDFVADRLVTAPKFSVLGQEI